MALPTISPDLANIPPLSPLERSLSSNSPGADPTMTPAATLEMLHAEANLPLFTQDFSRPSTSGSDSSTTTSSTTSPADLLTEDEDFSKLWNEIIDLPGGECSLSPSPLANFNALNLDHDQKTATATIDPQLLSLDPSPSPAAILSLSPPAAVDAMAPSTTPYNTAPLNAPAAYPRGPVTSYRSGSRPMSYPPSRPQLHVETGLPTSFPATTALPSSAFLADVVGGSSDIDIDASLAALAALAAPATPITPINVAPSSPITVAPHPATPTTPTKAAQYTPAAHASQTPRKPTSSIPAHPSTPRTNPTPNPTLSAPPAPASKVAPNPSTPRKAPRTPKPRTPRTPKAKSTSTASEDSPAPLQFQWINYSPQDGARLSAGVAPSGGRGSAGAGLGSPYPHANQAAHRRAKSVGNLRGVAFAAGKGHGHGHARCASVSQAM